MTSDVPAGRYSRVSVALHWTIAFAIIFQIVLGWRMGGPAKSAAVYQVFQLHKSVGVTILLLSLGRLAWRLLRPPPAFADTLKPWERALAATTHALFYVIMLGLPITGWIMVSASKTDIPTLLYGVVPWPHLPVLPHLAPGLKHVWSSAGEAGHGLLVKLTYALLLLHVGAALKHQFIDRDAIVSRMAPGVRPGRFGPIGLSVAAAAALSVGAGVLVFAGAPPLASPAPKPLLDHPGERPPQAQVAPAGAAAPAQIAADVAVAAKPTASSPVAPGASGSGASGSGASASGPPPRWLIDPSSTLGFKSSWSGQPIVGVFRRWSGQIVFDPQALDASNVRIVVDPSSVSTGDAQRDATLPTEDWFDAPNHPKAVFSAKRFGKVASGYSADGTLSLKGVSKPVRLSFTLTVSGDRAVADGTARIDRTTFAVGQGEYGGVDQIPADVEVDFHILAIRARGRVPPS